VKKLLIADGEGEFDQDVFVFGHNFRTNMNNFLKGYNGGHCAMVLIKCVTITTKGN